MAYPTDLDTFARPVSGVDSQDNPDSATLANDHSTAIEALQVKLGLGNSPAAAATAGQVPEADGAGSSAWGNLDVGYVNHGATAGTARPTGRDVVLWDGSVEPTNATDGDYWWDTTAVLMKRRVSGAFVGSGSGTYSSVVDAEGDLPDATAHTGQVFLYEVDGALHGAKSDGTNWVEILSPAEYLNEADANLFIPASELEVHSPGSVTPTYAAVASAGGERGWVMNPNSDSELTAPGRLVPSYWGSFDVYLRVVHTAASPTGTGVAVSVNHKEHLVGGLVNATATSVTPTTPTVGAQYELVEWELLTGVANNGGQHRIRVSRNGSAGGAADNFSASVYFTGIVLKRAS